jgi:hypothetical protein
VRILITSHAPIDDAGSGTRLSAVALALDAAGHTVRALAVDGGTARKDLVPTRRIVCRRDDPAADLPFERPRFPDQPGGGLRFAELSDGQMAAYREALRQALDAEIARFDPQIIHCDHVWLLGHLALESGVPYVLAAHESELAEARQDHRYLRLAEEAAENAGRIIVPHDRLAQQVRSTFGDLDGRITVVPAVADVNSLRAIHEYVAALTNIYCQVLDERLGQRWQA